MDYKSKMNSIKLTFLLRDPFILMDLQRILKSENNNEQEKANADISEN